MTHVSRPRLHGEQFLGPHLLPPPRPPGQVWAANDRNGLWLPHTGQGLQDRAWASEPGSETQHSQALPRKPSGGRQRPAGCGDAALPPPPLSSWLCSRASELKAGPVFTIGKCSVVLPPLPGTAGDGGSSPSRDKGTFLPDASPASSVQTPAPPDSLKRCRK